MELIIYPIDELNELTI